MKLNWPAFRDRGTAGGFRVSPISRTGSILTFGLLGVGILASIATKFTFASLPNVLPLVIGILVLDAVCHFLPRGRIVAALQTCLHGVSFLAVTILCAILAAYAMQRFALPLRDDLFARTDAMLGLNWLDYARWVDGHIGVQRVFHFAYDSIQIQILLPLFILAFSKRPEEVRTYLLAFAIALIVTIFISALLPAAGPIVFADRASFHILRFTGATPIDHLTRLREAGPLILGDPPGGIATFPSFHATVATLTPLILRNYRRTFTGLLVLDAAMLGGTVTEGAHYFVDVFAGIGMAFFAYAIARHIIGREDRAPAQARVQGEKPATQY